MSVEVNFEDLGFAVSNGLPITIMGVEYVPAAKKGEMLQSVVARFLFDNSNIADIDEDDWHDASEMMKSAYKSDAKDLLNVVANEVEEFISTLSGETPQAENADLILAFLRGE